MNCHILCKTNITFCYLIPFLGLISQKGGTNSWWLHPQPADRCLLLFEILSCHHKNFMMWCGKHEQYITVFDLMQNKLSHAYEQKALDKLVTNVTSMYKKCQKCPRWTAIYCAQNIMFGANTLLMLICGKLWYGT